MSLVPVLLFAACMLASAFFAASETAFISSNPYTLEYLEKQGSHKAGLVRRILARLDDLITALLIGNTLVNAAAASLATYIISTLLPGNPRVVLLATAATTILLLFFSEINPKIYAAYNPHKLAFLFARPVRGVMILFAPLIKVFTFVSSLLFRKSRERSPSLNRTITEDETKIFLTTGVQGMSAFRKKMISEILDLASRPIRDIMTPRPRIKALDISAPQDQVLESILSEEFSRFPVYRGRLDHIEGLIHTKDIIPYLIRREPIDLSRFLRKPFYIPESASVESALVQMRENAVHLAFVIDEFGNMEGLVTMEDLIEEIVGDIQDEYDVKEEEGWAPQPDGGWMIKGAATVKDLNERLDLRLPESADYATLAGFFLLEFGRIPREKDALDYRGRRFTVERMAKRHISLIRVEPRPAGAAGSRP
ncbi:MAG: hemolysin family protein [Candidatus Aminicenantes bacterium]|nr:hemolysin family protein [Candidatus Aminicenantes bacterium]